MGKIKYRNIFGRFIDHYNEWRFESEIYKLAKRIRKSFRGSIPPMTKEDSIQLAIGLLYMDANEIAGVFIDMIERVEGGNENV